MRFWQKTVRTPAATASTSPPGPTGGRQGHLLALPATRLGTHWDCCDGLWWMPNCLLRRQERLAENRRRLRAPRPGARYLLQGLLVCGSCGYGLSVQTSGLQQKYTYYTCPGVYVSELTHRRVCPNGRQRTEAVEAAVWADVSALLSEPQRLRQGFQRRQQSSQAPGPEVNQECLQGDVHKVRQSIGRLIDAYTAGLIETRDFEPRMQRLKERLAKLEGGSAALDRAGQAGGRTARRVQPRGGRC